MSKRRKAKPGKRTKRTDLPRTCSSGKRGFRYKGEATAATRVHKDDLIVYRCTECKEWHLANKVGRKERRRRAQEGRAS